MLNKIIRYFLSHRLISILILLVILFLGIATSPFDWHLGAFPRDPVSVDAIPDIGDNQQIIATPWKGRSPKDIQDQISYPLSSALLGISGVKTIRSTSMFGMSFIYVIFEDKVDFYWSRSRILEKLNSLPANLLPEDVKPSLGPDATALGQVYWYTLEGRDPKTGKPTGGWSPQELRSLQDFYVKYSLASVQGVAEVASVGGYVKEYQIELNPDAMRAFGVNTQDVIQAVKKSNLDIGAGTIEINKVEYLIRGLGYIKNIADLENAVISIHNNIPVKIKDIAFVNLGPATRRGGLDKEGVEAVGGVVVARYGSNPLEVIHSIKDKIKEIEASLPQKTLADGRISQLRLIPFYDRSSLIEQSVATLKTALSHEILICIIVIIILIISLRASLIIASMLPIAVLSTFIIMRYTGVQANITALSGIAIAIGVMVDVGIVFVESIIRHMEMPENRGINRGLALQELILRAVSEVSAPIMTAMATIIVSFLPVFAMQAQEGKLFHPLAYTKSFALISSLLLGIILLPTLSYYVFSFHIDTKKIKKIINIGLIPLGIALALIFKLPPALIISLIGINHLLAPYWKSPKVSDYLNIGLCLSLALYYLAKHWLPLGPQKALFFNMAFVMICISVILCLLWSLVHYYEKILSWCLDHRKSFIILPSIILVFGLVIWLGFNQSFGFMASGAEGLGFKTIRQTSFWKQASGDFPGIGQEFMPSLDEGSFLLMPTSMPNSGIEQNRQLIAQLDKRISSIPEIESTVGKWGRANSALDPAPIQMFENMINYRSEFIMDQDGSPQGFKVNNKDGFILKSGQIYDPKQGFKLYPADSLIPDPDGEYFRQWRPEIKNPDDIWKEIVKKTNLPGLSSAPKLRPIEARLVMLTTGMRAPMGLKIYGPDLGSIEKAGLILEKSLKEVKSIIPSSVFYDRAAGSPYLELVLNRENMARYGIKVGDLQQVLATAIGGEALSYSLEGRERYPIRIRYPRELREDPQAISNILIPTATGIQIPLKEVVDIHYTRGAQMIKSENTFLLGYVIFDKENGQAETDVVNQADQYLKEQIAQKKIILPKGVSYQFAGNYQEQIRASKRLVILIPISLILVLLILFFQFKTLTASLIHFSGVFVAFAGGFILLWLYGQGWFMNFDFAGINMRELFHIHTINLSVAVWVGFIALFGISTNDGVLMGSYIHQVFEELKPNSKAEIRKAVIIAGKKRVRPAAMTTAATLIALLPILSSAGKGADIMIPMAIPSFGGMLFQSISMFIVPVLQCWWRENKLKRQTSPDKKNDHE